KALAAKKDASAAASLDKAIELDPNVPVFYYASSAVSLENGDGARATGYLDQYAARLKADDKLDVTYGNVLRKLGKTDEALARFEKAIDAGGFSMAQALLSKATVLLEDKKDLDKAKEVLDQTLQIQEMFPDAHVKMGDYFFAKKEYVEGAQAYATALTQMKLYQTPREKMNALRESVSDALTKAGKKDVAKLWMTESGNLIR
ncbi:MAG: tetratricopeptide repeat protein, partial [Myxococcales bacterium]